MPIVRENRSVSSYYKTFERKLLEGKIEVFESKYSSTNSIYNGTNYTNTKNVVINLYAKK